MTPRRTFFRLKPALRFAFLALFCWLCCCGQRARAQALVSVTPRAGEIGLTGEITRIERAQNRFVLQALRVMTPDGKENALPQAKAKIVLTTSATTFAALFTPGSGSPLPHTGNDLSDLSVSASVIVIGRNGANGTITARLVYVLLPVSAQTTPAEDREEVRPPSDPPGKNLLLPTEAVENWGSTILEPAQARVEREDGVIKVTVETAGKEDWRVQLSQTGAFPEPGVSYTLSFRARAESARRMRVSAQVLGSDFHDIGVNRVAALDSEWHLYEYTFVARHLGAKGHLLPVFFFGTRKGITWLADVTLAVSYAEKRGNLLESAANPGAWKLIPQRAKNERGSRDRAALRVANDALEVSTFEVGTPAQEIAYQLIPSDAPPLLPGRSYLLSFAGKAGAERSLRIRGVAEPVKLGSEEKEFAIRFRVDRLTDFGAFPTFLIGEQIGPFTLRNLVLKEEKTARK